MFDWDDNLGEWFWSFFGLQWSGLDDCQYDWRCHTPGGGGSW